MLTQPEVQNGPEPIKAPENVHDLNELMRQAASLAREINRLETVRKNRLSRINKIADDRIMPLQLLCDRLLQVIVAYLRANQSELVGPLGSGKYDTPDVLVSFQIDTTGSLVVNGDLGDVVTYLEEQPNSELFVKTERSLIKDPLKRWLKEDKSRRIPGLLVKFIDTILIQLKPTPSEAQRGVRPTQLIRVEN